MDVTRRLAFPHGTNNEAEYWSLLAGLRWALEEAGRRGLRPQAFELQVVGDSLLVIRQLQGKWKARDPRMRGFRDEAMQLLERFGEVHLLHRPRRGSIAEFGH